MTFGAIFSIKNTQNSLTMAKNNGIINRLSRIPRCSAPIWCANRVRTNVKEAVSVETLKQSANRVVGTKQVLRALKAGTLARVYVANDSDTFLFQRVTRAAEEAGVPAIRVESMKELGQACQVAVDTAAAGILK